MQNRVNILSASLFGIKPVDIPRNMHIIYGDVQLSHMSVCGWIAKFKTMHQHLKDAIHICHPATITTAINIKIIRDIPRKDAIYTISQLVWTTNLSLARIHEF